MPEDQSPEPIVKELEGRLDRIRDLKHEISNALMGLIGYAELLDGQPELSENSREKLRIIRTHCKRLQDQAIQLAEIAGPRNRPPGS